MTDDELDPQEKAEEAARDPKRWVRFKDIDWLAIRLQIIRGRKLDDVGAEFGVGTGSITMRANAEKWKGVSDAERRGMSEDIVLTARARAALKGFPVDEDALKRAARWRLIDPNAPIWKWTGKGKANETMEMDDDETETADDFTRAECDRAFLELDALVRRLGFDPRAAGVPCVIPDGGAEDEAGEASDS